MIENRKEALRLTWDLIKDRISSTNIERMMLEPTTNSANATEFSVGIAPIFGEIKNRKYDISYRLFIKVTET